MRRQLGVASLLAILALIAHDALASDDLLIPTIEFKLGSLSSFPVTIDDQQEKIIVGVRENLAQWQYNVVPHSAHNALTLTAVLGKITHETTPIGFSFSSGNSDPRAGDFQKMDVIAITCQLTKNLDASQIEQENKLTFSADLFTQAPSKEKVTEKLIDKISTTCLNLLQQSKIPIQTKKISNAPYTPTWMPDLRIEEIPKEGAPSPSSDTPQTDQPKALIIHNQGSPIIFQFGHERR